MTFSPQELSDRAEINDVIVRYGWAIDTKDWALLDTCFTSSAELDYTSTGGEKGSYADLRRWLEKVLSPFAVTVHHIGNVSVELHGDRARARTYLWNPMGLRKADGELHWFTVSAHYVDELVRTDDGWRIQKRVQERGVFIGGPPRAR